MKARAMMPAVMRAMGGKVKTTILRGSVIMENGEYFGRTGEGRFIEQN